MRCSVFAFAASPGGIILIADVDAAVTQPLQVSCDGAGATLCCCPEWQKEQ